MPGRTRFRGTAGLATVEGLHEEDSMGTGLWLSLPATDPERMVAWLTGIGFTERAVHRAPEEPSRIVHAELDWPRGGGVMLGQVGEDPTWPSRPGGAAAYLVCDDCDATFARAVELGAEVLREPADQDYGGRAAAVRDAEGNLWSLGTYAGA